MVLLGAMGATGPMEPTGPVAADVTDVTGKLVVRAEYDPARTTFQRQVEIRKSVEILVKECPGEIALIIVADAAAADIAKLAGRGLGASRKRLQGAVAKHYQPSHLSDDQAGG